MGATGMDNYYISKPMSMHEPYRFNPLVVEVTHWEETTPFIHAEYSSYLFSLAEPYDVIGIIEYLREVIYGA